MMRRDFKYSNMNSRWEKMCKQNKSLHEFYQRKVKDIMLTPKSTLPCVDKNTDVVTVISLLTDKDHVWVIDSTEPTQLLGVITESDTMALLSPPLSSPQTFDRPDSRSLQFGIFPNIEEIMSKKPVTVSPEETIKEALLKMKEQKIKHLPVVDETRGFISEVSLHQFLKEYLNQYIAMLQESKENH